MITKVFDAASRLASWLEVLHGSPADADVKLEGSSH